MTQKGQEQVEAEHWTMSREREFIENILCQRFNFLLVFYSLVLAGAFTTKLQLNFNLVLTLGALVTSLLSITIARVRLRLDCILKVIENQQSHPTKITNDRIKEEMKATKHPLL